MNGRKLNRTRLLQVQRQLKEIERELLEQERNDDLYDAIRDKNYMADIIVTISPNKHITFDGVCESYGLRTIRKPSTNGDMGSDWYTNIFGKIDRDVAIKLFDECLTVLKSAKDYYESMSEDEWLRLRKDDARV